MQHPNILELSRSALLIIDMQEAFRASIKDFDKFAQRIARAIGHQRGLTVSEGLIFVIQAGFVFAALLQVVIEEVVGHVEPFWKRRVHVIHFLCATSASSAPLR